MELDLGQWVAIGVCAILLLGYIRGYIYNRRMAERVSAWLREGLAQWGEVAAGERLPGMATGGSLVVNHASAPFRRIEAIFILEPRENLLFWLFYCLSGRRDELVLRIFSQSPPEQEADVARSGDKDFERRVAEAEKKPLTTAPGPGKLQIAWREKKGAQAIENVRRFSESYRHALLRLALRSKQPHLFVRIHLAAVQSKPAQEFFAELQRFAD
ncbi:MAG: hypothetical protein AB1894_15555 [Chloroflexota bacterium]